MAWYDWEAPISSLGTTLSFVHREPRRNIRVEPFISSLFQWASTLTQSGANYPFALPLAMDKLGSDGFKAS